MTFSPTQKLSLHRLISAMSVRNRIAAIAVIPVIGFLANGLAFTSGETQVGTAFEAVRGAAVLADASREFKAALAGMQMAAKDFVAQPSDEEIKAFDASQELASSSLDTIASSIDAAQRGDVDAAREALGGMRLNFDALAEEERELGFTPDQGTRKTLEDSGAMIERAIAGGVSWLSAAEQTRLLVSLSNMRRFEA
jgi:methyl-accepting chemotaxis protein